VVPKAGKNQRRERERTYFVLWSPSKAQLFPEEEDGELLKTINSQGNGH